MTCHLPDTGVTHRPAALTSPPYSIASLPLSGGGRHAPRAAERSEGIAGGGTGEATATVWWRTHAGSREAIPLP